MKALVYEGKRNLVLNEVEMPKVLQGKVLIKVAYTGICGSDILLWNDKYPRVKPPVIIGHEFSGVVEEIGEGVTNVNVGDRVVVEPLITCGECHACTSGEYNLCNALGLIGIDTDGAMADYVIAAPHQVYKVPSNVSLKEAAFVEPLAVGVHMVRKAEIKKGQTVLVVGGGPIGLIAASVAKIEGAEVYISEINPYRIKMATEFGFNVINPTEVDLNEKIQELTGNQGIDVSIEATGTQIGLTNCIEITNVKGVVLIAGMAKSNCEIDTYKILAKELNVVGSRVYVAEDYEKALRLMENSQFQPLKFISREITLEEVVEKGMKAIEEGEPVLKVIVKIDDGI